MCVSNCFKKNYHECLSEFDAGICTTADSFFNDMEVCADGGHCSTVISWEESVVLVPDGIMEGPTLTTPRRDVTTEMICLGLDVEQHMKDVTLTLRVRTRESLCVVICLVVCR